MNTDLSIIIISMTFSVLLEAEVEAPQTLKHQIAKKKKKVKSLLAALRGLKKFNTITIQ